MYTGTAPTLRYAREQWGEMAVNTWLNEMVSYMFSLTGTTVDGVRANELVGMIRVRYPWLKLTEFMHFVFLFRAGEFGKVYGKADYQAVMLALKEYCKLRDGYLDEYRLRAQAAPQMEKDPKQVRGELTAEESAQNQALINHMSSAKFRDLGAWRKEPWGTFICQAYNVFHTLTTEPWDMTDEERHEWAISHGWAETPS